MTIANEILLNGETLRFEHGGNVVAYPLEALSLINRLGVRVPLCIAWLRHGYHTCWLRMASEASAMQTVLYISSGHTFHMAFFLHF